MSVTEIGRRQRIQTRNFILCQVLRSNREISVSAFFCGFVSLSFVFTLFSRLPFCRFSIVCSHRRCNKDLTRLKLSQVNRSSEKATVCLPCDQSGLLIVTIN